jgi:hypothetical protein
MQWPCCHSCILPNGTAGIILWLVMSHDYSSIYNHVACGRYRKIMQSQNRDLRVRLKNARLQSYGIPAASVLLTDSQVIVKWTAPISWQIYVFLSNKRSFLEEGAAWRTTCGSSWQLVCSHKSGFNRLAWRTQYSPHTTPTVFTLSGH